jgi:uncharacterized membrane protein YdbT with pleckstrin-like domain
MSYVKTILGPDEKVVFTGKIHRIVYLKSLLLIVCGPAAIFFGSYMAGAPSESPEANAGVVLFLVGLLVLLLGILSFASTAINRWTTEIAVTDKRLIFKRGLIRRHTKEMNIDKIESVFVDQSILGRILDYGDVDVRGTGSSIEDLDLIAAPIALRRSIEAGAAA